MKNIIKIVASCTVILFLFYLIFAMFALGITIDSLTRSNATGFKYGEISRVSDSLPDYTEQVEAVDPGVMK